MIPSFLRKLFARAEVVPAKTAEDSRKEALAVDPLDPISKDRKHREWEEENTIKFRSVKDFPVDDSLPGDGGALSAKVIGDAALKLAANGHLVKDDSEDGGGMLKSGPDSEYAVPAILQRWYMAQGFIGYQSCAIIAQNWLVDKACSMAGEDAARNGWVIKARGGEDLEDEDHTAILNADKMFKVKDNLIELNRFKNVFGIRVAIFQVESDDPLYYEKPFNIDGIKEGSYTGISQVDPYWMMPVMTSKNTSDPSNKDFYDPEYWVISGKKYHKSHLVIVRGPQPADILKPTYIFGGVPLTQRIYERVYAAERTANEAPLMALSKRTMAIHADLDKVMADQAGFERRLMTWIRYRDNHGVKVLGREEAMEQFDINMSDFDSVIMNQYQLVAAIARVPATKLLGTSPKGFNATGEFEMKSYHEELESIQEHVMMPMLERHYDILVKHLGLSSEVEIVCNSVDSITAKERADLNDKKVTTGINLINAGVISPDEERQRIRDDEHSGYNRLTNDAANEKPGMSPENIANFQKAGAAETKAGASETEAEAGAVEAKPGEPGSSTQPGNEREDDETDTVGSAEGAQPGTLQALLPLLAQQLVSGKRPTGPAHAAERALLLHLVNAMSASKRNEPTAPPGRVRPPIQGTKPGTEGREPTVGGIHNVVNEARDAMDWNPHTLPKMRINGLTCMIENPRGSIRKGISAETGEPWSVKMANHYGYIKGYEGADGDEVDCFIGPNLRAPDVYVVQQKGLDGEFDEHKCMIGFGSEDEAKAAYHANYKPDWDGFDGMRRMSMDDFKTWLDSGSAASPLFAPNPDANQP